MNKWTYEKAGVPHLKGDPDYNHKIVKLVKATHRSGVMGSATGFAALFDLKKTKMKDPLLVAGTDGVGTKLEIARLQNKHDSIGIDLVAMCVNDIITCGAEPLFFLDYFATGRFEPKTTAQVLKGIAKGCRESDCALIGGETAIMPGFYNHSAKNMASQYDLAGFAVGVVERKKLITGEKIKKGDLILGLASSGFHSNGYSLLRKIFTKKQLQGPIGRDLLRPTKLYVRPVKALLKAVDVRGLVNITGGGFWDNIPRMMPRGLTAVIQSSNWPRSKLFQQVQDSGNISDFEMMRTFNMGIGMVAVVSKRQVDKAQIILKRFKVRSWVIGEIVKGSKAVEVE